VLPSFELEIDYNIHQYTELSRDASSFLYNMEICKQNFGSPGDPKTELECIKANKPPRWKIAHYEEHYVAFEIPTGKIVPFYNKILERAESREIVHKFALYIK